MIQTSTSLELRNKTVFNVVRLKKQDLFNDAHVGNSRGEKGEEKLRMERKHDNSKVRSQMRFLASLELREAIV